MTSADGRRHLTGRLASAFNAVSMFARGDAHACMLTDWY